jgi:hypothetical protein
VDLATLRPADLGAFREMATDLRGVAASAGETAGEIRLLDELLGQVDSAEFDRLVGRLRQSEDGVQALNRYARELNQTLAIAARNSDVADPGQVANVRESIRLQREHLLAIQATIPALGQLADIERRFEASVSRDAAATIRERDAAFAQSVRTLGLYGRTVNATSAEAVGAWRSEAAAIREQAATLDLPREAMLRLEAVVQQVERAFERAQNAAHKVVPPPAPTPVPDPGAAERVDALAASTRRWTGDSQRAANAAVAVAFGIEALARSGDSADQGLRTAIRAVAAFAAPFGSEGLLVSGIAAATAAVLDFVAGTPPAAKAADLYAASLKGVRDAAGDAAIGLHALTAEQGARARLQITGQLEEARKSSALLRRDLLRLVDQGARGFDALPRFAILDPRTLSDLAKIQPLVQDLVPGLRTGAVSADQFGARLAAVADANPALRRTITQLAGMTDQIGQSDESAKNFLSTLRRVGEAQGNSFGGFATPRLTGLEGDLANARQIAEAQRASGTLGADAARTGQRAWDAYRHSQDGARFASLTFADALAASNTPAQLYAQTILRDATALARLTDGAKTAKTALDAIRDAAQAAVARAGAIGAQVATAVTPDATLVDAYAAAVSGVGAQYVRLSALIDAQGGPLRANIDLVREWAAVAGDVDRLLADTLKNVRLPDVRITPEIDVRALTDTPIPPVVLPFTAEQTTLRQDAENAVARFQALVDAQGEVKIRLGLAEAAGDATGAVEQRRALVEVTRQIDAAKAAVARYAAALPADQQADFWKRIGGDANGAANAITRATSAAAQFAARMSAVGDAVRGVLGIAEAFGQVDEATRRTVDGIANTIGALGRAGDVLDKIQAKDPTAGIGSLFTSLTGIGSIIGVIGGAVGLISGLFNRGPSATERALRSNEDALERLRAEMGALRVTLGSLTVGQAAAQSLASNRTLQTTLRMPGFITDNGEAYRAVVDQLHGLGLTFGQLNALAQQFDISLINDKGRVVAGAFQQLADVLALQREKMLQLDASIAGITDRLAQRADIFDVGDDPARQFADQITALAQVAAGTDLAHAFEGRERLHGRGPRDRRADDPAPL